MKLITLVFLIIISTSLYASNSDVVNLDDDLETQRADGVIKEMCESFHKAHAFGSLTPEDEPQYLLRKAVAKFNSVPLNSKSINKKVELFWNKYNDRLICKLPEAEVIEDLKWRKGSIHYAKFVIHYQSSAELFTRYLL